MTAQRRIYLQGFFLFGVFFLPGYWNQLRISPGEGIVNAGSLLLTLLWRIPAVILMSSLILGEDKAFRAKSGWKKPTGKDFLFIFPAGGITLLISWLFSPAYETVLSYSLQGTGAVLLLFFAALIPAAAEELFFRSWCLHRLLEAGWSPLWGAFFSAGLFAAGHLWQGWGGGAAAFLSALLYSFWFLKRPNFFALTAAHTLHNFLAVVIVYFQKL